MKRYIRCSKENNFESAINTVLSKRDYSDTNLSFMDVERSGDTFIEFTLCGGLNGHGDWEDYFDDLSDFIDDCKQNIQDLKDVYMIDAENDCVDDVFYVKFRINFV